MIKVIGVDLDRQEKYTILVPQISGKGRRPCYS